MIGKLLGGRYQVVGILGTGGFGQTFAASDTHRPGSPECVVKHLKPASSNSSFLQSARRLFQSEAETLEKLGSHDQIPRLLAYFEENQEFYLVQDFIQGHSLNAELQPGQIWHESQVRQLLREVLSILEFVHNNGVIHRDIKPNNLIKRHQDGKVVLVDFGSVKQAWTQVITELGQTSASFATNIAATIGIGTPGYMPTEQGRGRPRHSSDIYALGIIGIQALTGLNPMQLEEDVDTGELLWRHQAQVSDELASVLTKMVHYHFKDRFQTAAEALQALNFIAPEQQVVDVNVIPLLEKQSTPAQITVFFPQFSQEPLPDANIIPVALPNLADIPVNSQPSPAAVVTSERSHLGVTTIVTKQATIESPPKEPQASLNQHPILVNQTAALPSKAMSEKYPTNYNRWRIGAGITAMMISLIAGYALYWQPRPSISKTLERIASLKAAGKYEECLSQAPTVPQNSFFYSDAQTLLHECQFAQAKNLAAERKFYAAIGVASKIPKDATLYPDAQQLIGQWSDNILEVATNTYRSGKLNEAIATAKFIPESSPVYQQTQAAIKQWNQEWEKNNSYLQVAQNLVNQAKWQNAIVEAKKVTDNPYWQAKIKPITQQAESKIAASQTFTKSSTLPATRRTPTRTTLRRITRTATRRTPTRTTPRRITRTATQIPTRTTPKRVTRTATRRTPTRTTPKRVTRTATRRTPTRTTPRRVTRTATRRTPTRTTPKRVTRTTPRQPSYTWTTKTVP